MAENAGEIKTKEDGISRRGFIKGGFKTGAIVGAGLVAGGAVINATETSVAENGISTQHGIFFPVYETHYRGVEADKIPDNLDVLFREVAIANARKSEGGLLKESIRHIMETRTYSYNDLSSSERHILSDPILKKTADNAIEIMFGDVTVPGNIGLRGFTNAVRVSAEGLAGIGISLAMLKDSLKKKEKSSSSILTRRTFLKGAGLLGVVWLMEPSVYFLSRGGPWIGEFNTGRENALNRIVDRINGITSSLHPEDTVSMFFRNLVMADKMLTVAEDIEQKTGQKAKIGFNVEYGHNGIGDFLRVGHDICRWIIAQHPKSVLQGVADLNGGSENLWTARLFKFPKGFFEEGSEKRWEQVGDRTVVDTKLKEMLEKKLA